MKIWLRVLAVIALATVFVFSALHFRRVPDPPIRGRLASEWAADLLSNDYRVRGAAQGALLELGEDAVPQLSRLLRKRNPPWERHVMRLNGFLPFLNYQSVDAAACRLQSAVMISLLGPQANEAITDLIDALAFDFSSNEPERALFRVGATSIEPLSRAVKDARNPKVRERSAKVLGQFENLPPRSIRALMNATRDKVAGVREQAALSLGATAEKDPEASAALVLLTNDVAEQVRAAAFKALREIALCNEAVFSALDRGLDDKSASVRLEAAKSTWRLKRDSAATVPVLIQVLAGYERRWEAAYALGEIGEEAAPAIPQLVQALAQEHVSRPFRTPPSSAFALGKIGPAAIPALSQLLTNRDAHVRSGALLAFGFMGSGGAESVPHVLRLLKDKDPEVRHIAALTLPAIGAKDERVIAGLADCLSDEDVYIRSAAAAALREIAPEKQWVVQPE